MNADLAQTLASAVREAMPMARALFEDLAANTAGAKGVTRTPYGEGEQYAHRLLVDRAKALGLQTDVDPAGNSYLTLPGTDTGAPAWVVGSHLDSVPNGGNFDGAAGVIAGISAIVALRSAGISLRQNVTVMCIRAEEAGSWFSGSHNGHLGSRMALGLLKSEELDLAIRVDTGKSLGYHMAECGFDPKRVLGPVPYLESRRVRGYLELHIEQGPVLEHRGIPVGIVTSIRGNSRLRSPRCVGAYNHGGATPQELRKDAVIATSELILAIDRKWNELHAAGRDLIFTVGKIHTDSKLHSLSKVPGEVGFSLDIRSGDPDVLALMRTFVAREAETIGVRRNVRFELGLFSVTAPTVLDRQLRRLLSDGSKLLGIPSMEIASGGGHDAQEFVEAGMPAAMIFVRNANGSHVAEEAMEIDDFALGTQLLAWTLASQ